MTLQTFRDADEALLKIGRLQRDIKAEELLLNDGIERLKGVASQKIGPLREELEAADEQLMEFIESNKSDIASGPSKSVQLSFGTIGVKDEQSVPQRMRGYTDEIVAKNLIKNGFEECTKIEYKWIKNAVKALDESLRARLERYGIRFTKPRRNRPFYTIDESKIPTEAK